MLNAEKGCFIFFSLVFEAGTHSFLKEIRFLVLKRRLDDFAPFEDGKITIFSDVHLLFSSLTMTSSETRSSLKEK